MQDLDMTNSNAEVKARTDRKRQAGYLVASFEKFPGLKVPLLSDEECKARGIEPPQWPPLETWSPEQQQAFRELQDILVAAVVKEIVGSGPEDAKPD